MRYSPDMSMDIINLIRERFYNATAQWIDAKAGLEKTLTAQRIWKAERERSGDIIGIDPQLTHWQTTERADRRRVDRTAKNRLYYETLLNYTIETFIRNPGGLATDQNRHQDDSRKYSVLLLYPDYMSENYGQETYHAHVTADSIPEAVWKARLQAIQDQEHIYISEADDFFCLSVTQGHNQIAFHDFNTYQVDQ